MMVGAAATCIAGVALSVASCGTLTYAMAALSFVTFAVDTAYGIEGAAEMVEAGTGHNSEIHK